MRKATYLTLNALYERKKVTAINAIEYENTRISNVISLLRNTHDIQIITDRVKTNNNKWYGSYKLEQSEENLRKVRLLLTNQDEVQKS